MADKKNWLRLLAYVTDSINQDLLLRTEYLAAENRILKSQIKGRLQLSDGERATLAEIAKRLGRKALEEIACIAKPDTILAVVYVVKGVERGAVPAGLPSPVDVTMGGTRIKRGVKVWPVATSLLKSELFGWLRLERPTDESGDPFPSGYCHFPKYHDEYFKQLTAEQLMSRTVRGYRRTEWQKTRERNEALDCRVYARAAASISGMDRFREDNWKDFEDAVRVQPVESVIPVQSQQPPKRDSWFNANKRTDPWFSGTSGWIR
jgi:phage terminase large subunit GpA-like protein